MKYVCPICGYVYDEAGGIPWAELPESWRCPLCGAPKADFAPEGSAGTAAEAEPVTEAGAELRPLTDAEISALCSSLAKGCEKQYLQEQAAAFRKLADWFGARAPAAADPSFGRLLELIDADLAGGIPAAEAAARQNGDRGALRSLTWSGKVTRILRSLLTRFTDGLPENACVWVCTICGFVYIGDELPDVCPVCKVPARKFERIGG